MNDPYKVETGKYKLEEVLWEFTNKCNKNCEYCGSKELINRGLSLELHKKLDICKQIAAIDTIKELTFTGGEPSVEINDLYKVVHYFKNVKNNMKLKMLTNGNLFRSKDSTTHRFVIANMTSIGLSLNSIDDLIELRQYANNIPYEKTVAVINFGTHNIDEFEDLIKAGLQFSAIQVQLTMGNNLQLDLPQIRTLLDKIQKVNQSGLGKIYIGDNLNFNECIAGKKACSITYNGKVIACLSHRCFTTVKIQGDLYVDKLTDIWEYGFSEYRNREACPISCKDCTRICKLKETNTNDTGTWTIVVDSPNIVDNPYNRELPGGTTWPVEPKDMPNIMTYAVVDPGQHVYVYGVVNPRNWGAGSKPYDFSNNTTGKI